MRHLMRWRRRRPLLTLTLMVVALALVFEVMPDPVEDIADLVLTLAMTVALTWIVIDLVRHTEVWTTRRLGLVGNFAGEALLYTALGVGSFVAWQSHLLDLTRACLAVGVTHLLLGMHAAKQREEAP